MHALGANLYISPRSCQQLIVHPMTLRHFGHPLGRALTIHAAFRTILAIAMTDFFFWGMLRAAFSALTIHATFLIDLPKPW